MPLNIGTSGWQYAHWRDSFYPRGVPQARWLEYYAERFATVELNNSFYMLPKRESFEAWRARTPPDFVFAVKMSRYLTHMRHLTDAREPVRRFFSRADCLGEKLGPVLLQLPPTMHEAVDRLDATLRQFPRGTRVAVECRHESWYTDALRRCLERHSAALVAADRPNLDVPLWRTAGWGYIRFHEGRARPRPCYGRQALDAWVDRLADLWRPTEEVFVFFNNDAQSCAPRDAVVFAGLAVHRGFQHGRVPLRSEARVNGRRSAARAAARGAVRTSG